MKCIWEATAEKGFYIGLTFQDRFFIEDSPGCDKDFLLVQQYTESWSDIQRICSRKAPEKISSTQWSMKLVFRSNDDVVGDGFVANFERHCGGLFYAEDLEYQFTNPEIPESYRRSVNCRWTIVSRYPLEQQHVLVSFPSTPTCASYQLTLTMQYAEGRVRTSDVCGWSSRREYIAPQAITAVFQTDNLVPGELFRL